MQAYIRDVLDDATSMLDRLAVSAEVLNHLDNIYLTRLNLEVAEAGERMCPRKWQLASSICAGARFSLSQLSASCARNELDHEEIFGGGNDLHSAVDAGTRDTASLAFHHSRVHRLACLA